MSERDTGGESCQWMCSRCGCRLETGNVQVSYLGTAFPVRLLRCSRCGLTLVPEDLAMGKMAEAEQILEDK